MSASVDNGTNVGIDWSRWRRYRGERLHGHLNVAVGASVGLPFRRRDDGGIRCRRRVDVVGGKVAGCPGRPTEKRPWWRVARSNYSIIEESAQKNLSGYLSGPLPGRRIGASIRLSEAVRIASRESLCQKRARNRIFWRFFTYPSQSNQKIWAGKADR